MYEWNTAQNEPIMILMLGLLESMLSKPNINIIILFQKKSIHTLENKVLMHQCAIAQRISKSIASPILNSLYTLFGSPVPGGQKPQRGTNGRCSTLVEESNGVQAAVNDR